MSCKLNGSGIIGINGMYFSTEGERIITVGNNNIIYGDRNIILGNNNFVDGITMGNNNTNYGDRNIILGNNNFVDGKDNILIYTNGININGDFNTYYFGKEMDDKWREQFQSDVIKYGLKATIREQRLKQLLDK